LGGPLRGGGHNRLAGNEGAAASGAGERTPLKGPDPGMPRVAPADAPPLFRRDGLPGRGSPPPAAGTKGKKARPPTGARARRATGGASPARGGPGLGRRALTGPSRRSSRGGVLAFSVGAFGAAWRPAGAQAGGRTHSGRRLRAHAAPGTEQMSHGPHFGRPVAHVVETWNVPGETILVGSGNCSVFADSRKAGLPPVAGCYT